mmetsp:Transcript_8930/g.22610  ORF Transcript_8930/g.22610 Transcript_8930/m.22610 type:complete len:105 (+) Transcript_8930:662-976(+)
MSEVHGRHALDLLDHGTAHDHRRLRQGLLRLGDVSDAADDVDAVGRRQQFHDAAPRLPRRSGDEDARRLRRRQRRRRCRRHRRRCHREVLEGAAPIAGRCLQRR